MRPNRWNPSTQDMIEAGKREFQHQMAVNTILNTIWIASEAIKRRKEMKTAYIPDPYSYCSNCNEILTSDYSVKRHIKWDHKIESHPWIIMVCPDCGKLTKTPFHIEAVACAHCQYHHQVNDDFWETNEMLLNRIGGD